MTRRQFDPSGLLHLATDNALHSVFMSLLNGCEQAREQGGLQDPSPPCQGYNFNVLETCSQRPGKSRNPGNSVTALMIKQASSEKCSPE